MRSIFLIGCFALLNSCMVKDGKYVSDNPVEEIAEEVVRAEIGLDLDFTPGTKEGK